VFDRVRDLPTGSPPGSALRRDQLGFVRVVDLVVSLTGSAWAKSSSGGTSGCTIAGGTAGCPAGPPIAPASGKKWKLPLQRGVHRQRVRPQQADALPRLEQRRLHVEPQPRARALPAVAGQGVHAGLLHGVLMLPADPSYNYKFETDILELLGNDPSTMFMTYHYNNRKTSCPVDSGKGHNGACATKDYSKNFVRMGLDFEVDCIPVYQQVPK
jgi:hypothetical protein